MENPINHDEMVPEYILAKERRIEICQYMCRFFAHQITCPNEDEQKGITCISNHSVEVRDAHDAICSARNLGRQLQTKEIKFILNPLYNKNNQDDIDDMFLKEECLKNYPKKPSQ